MPKPRYKSALRSPAYARWTKRLHIKTRKDLAEVIKFFRRNDRSRNYTLYRGLSEYSQELGLTKIEIVSEINKRLNSSQPVRILDVGMGDGEFLDALEKRYGDRIQCEGISLARIGAGKRKIHICPIEKFLRPKYYDYIVSVFGIGYSTNISLAIQNVYNSLRVGGTAHLMVRVSHNQLVLLEKAGIPLEFKMDLMGYRTLILHRTSEKPLNLRKKK